MRPAQYVDAVTGWMAALRDGDTRTWDEWLGDRLGDRTGSEGDLAPRGAVLPGAGQLELLRRLALTAPPDLAGLADLVCSTSPVGRGAVDIPLPWPGERRSLGTPAVAPESLPAPELLRVALGVLARLLDGAGGRASDAPSPAGRSDRRPGWHRRRFRVHGAPASADAVRRALTAAGLVEGDFRAVHLVLTGPVEQVVQQHWTARSRRGGTRPWRRTWRAMAARDRLPQRLQPVPLADRIAVAAGADRVHLLAAADPADAARLAATLLGTALPRTTEPLDPPALVDLRRRINPVLGQQFAPADLPGLHRLLESWTPGRDVAGSGTGLAVPPGLRSWAAAAAERTAEQVRVAGYPVHGDVAALTSLLPSGTSHGVPPADTLAVALAAIASGWAAVAAGGIGTGSTGRAKGV
ncbi:hypothetical protein [Nocardioides terrisoli]|uniref:hypothetical protein n=1 Tax=Nocardioides terrisoli TaxID=3388267 RepID=UPI00287B9D5D|nr:hypothetical protein [Nocardioides marmorisolisilvae]